MILQGVSEPRAEAAQPGTGADGRVAPAAHCHISQATRERVPWVDQLGVDLACPMSQGGCRPLSLPVTARAHRRVGALTTRSAT